MVLWPNFRIGTFHVAQLWCQADSLPSFLFPLPTSTTFLICLPLSNSLPILLPSSVLASRVTNRVLYLCQDFELLSPLIKVDQAVVDDIRNGRVNHGQVSQEGAKVGDCPITANNLCICIFSFFI